MGCDNVTEFRAIDHYCLSGYFVAGSRLYLLERAMNQMGYGSVKGVLVSGVEKRIVEHDYLEWMANNVFEGLRYIGGSSRQTKHGSKTFWRAESYRPYTVMSRIPRYFSFR